MSDISPKWLLQQVQRDLRASISRGRYSPIFLVGLWYEALEGRNHLAILQEIRHLEDPNIPSRSIKEKQFRGQVLGPHNLWYKHYFLSQFLAKNLLDALSVGRVKEIIAPAAKKNGGFITEEVIAMFSREFVHGTIDARSARGKLTGEYIVFEKTNAGNHYLTLAKHGDDDATLERVKQAREIDAQIGGGEQIDFILDDESRSS